MKNLIFLPLWIRNKYTHNKGDKSCLFFSLFIGIIILLSFKMTKFKIHCHNYHIVNNSPQKCFFLFTFGRISFGQLGNRTAGWHSQITEDSEPNRTKNEIKRTEMRTRIGKYRCSKQKQGDSCICLRIRNNPILSNLLQN